MPSSESVPAPDVPAHSSWLRSTREPLVAKYDCAMLDLDGVVYVGPDAVPGVPAVLERVRAAGMSLAFVTNNAARPAPSVATHLRELGVTAEDSDVVTSAQAAAHLLRVRCGAGSRVLVVGGEGLDWALRAEDLVPVRSHEDAPVAVAQGFHPTVGWTQLAEGAAAIHAGAWWVAANLDLTIPTPEGAAPGNGALVNALAEAVGRRPDDVAGKPARPLFDETVRRVSSTRPLIVGDRLDTDIEGAIRVGADSLLVMTGVTDLPGLLEARPSQRPTYLAWTLDGLLSAPEAPRRGPDGWLLGRWGAHVEHGRVVVRPRDRSDPGASPPRELAARSDALVVTAAAGWAWQDEHGTAVSDIVGAEYLRGETGPDPAG